MLPPEVMRIVLLIGLAATGYMMILAWNNDRTSERAAITYSQEPEILDDAGSAPLPEVESPEVTASNNAIAADNGVDDIPQLEVQVAQPEIAVAAATEDRWVKVSTQTLNVWLNTIGGDIVRVQLRKFPVSLEQPDTPYQLLEQSSAHVYIAQSGLIGRDGVDSQGRARYTAESSEYIVETGEQEVVLTTRMEGRTARKIFTFRADDHLIDVRYELDNESTEPQQAGVFARIKRDTRPPSIDESFSLAPQPYLGAAFTSIDERYNKIDFEDVDDRDFYLDDRTEGGWVAFLQHYFLSAWIPAADGIYTYSAQRSRDGYYYFGFKSATAQVVQPGATGTWNMQFYAGPKDQQRLEEIAPNLNLTIDYGFLWWLAIPLFTLLNWLHSLVGNWGVAIILLTVVVKALLYPLSAAGYKSMANMRRVAPAMKKLQERYANDREKLSKEMMALYQKEGANPLGGCLPMLLPMPIFIALYWVLFESVELRQAPFFLWIDDLSKMDPWFILPLLMGASTYWMQSLNPQMGDPMQQRMMQLMPIMFTVLFLFFPAGLVLYWLVNNLLSIAQQQYVYRRVDQAQA